MNLSCDATRDQVTQCVPECHPFGGIVEVENATGGDSIPVSGIEYDVVTFACRVLWLSCVTTTWPSPHVAIHAKNLLLVASCDGDSDQVPTLFRRQLVSYQDQLSHVVLCTKKIRQRNFQSVGKCLCPTQIREMFSLLVLVHSSACRLFIDACIDAKLLLRIAFPTLCLFSSSFS